MMKENYMSNIVTVLAPAKLAKGVTEAQLLAASAKFQKEFVSGEPDVLRRELIKKADGTYIDIVQFTSVEAAHQVIAREMESAVCAEFFSIMDMTGAEDMEIEFHPSLATY